MLKFFPQIMRAADGAGGGGSATPSAPPEPAGTPSSPASPAATPSAPATPAQSPSGLTQPSTPGPSGAPAVATPGEVSGDDDRGSTHGTDGLFEFPDDFTGRSDETPETPAAATPAAPTPPAPAQPTPPAPAQPGAEAQPPAQPEPPAQPQPAEATPPPGPQEPSPPPSPAEPGRLAQSMVENEEFLIDQLATREFNLKPEEIEALNEDATAYVPKLLAKVHLKGQINMMRQLQQVVPAMVQAQMQVLRRNTQNEDQFFSRWPELDRVKHGDTVRNYARIWRQANPNASLNDMIEDLGPMVMMKAKVAPGSRPSQAGPQPAANGRQPPPPPFKPALGGPATPPAPAEDDPWAGLGQDHEQEE